MTSNSNKPGIFEQPAVVGNPARAGPGNYDADKKDFLVEGPGAKVGGWKDASHNVCRRLKGDFIVTARGRFVGAGFESHRKIGWMLRRSLDPDAAHATTGIHGDGLTSFQFRRKQGGVTEEIRFAVSAPDIIQLERKGNLYKM